MAISTVVTEKDKKLIVILVLFLIVAGVFWFLIKPTVNDIDNIKADIAYAESSKNELRYKISKIPDYEKEISDYSSEFDKISANYYRMMQSEQIDNLITGMALDMGFNKTDLKELSINMPEECVTLQPYSTLSNSNNENNKLPFVYYSNVGFTLSGTKNMLQDFLDKIVNGYDSIRITNFSWKSLGKDSDLYQLSVNFDIYMINDEER